ncbi:MAG: hypothetical protein ACPGN3_17215 [Opitutales bacterium]
MRRLFICIFAFSILVINIELTAQEEENDEYLRLPSAHFLPIEAKTTKRTSARGESEFALNIKTRVFDVEAPLTYKGWRMLRLPNNRVSLRNILQQDATVTFSFFKSPLFFQMARKMEDWKTAYLDGLVFDRFAAAEVNNRETFPDAGRHPHHLFSKAPKSIIDYTKRDLNSGQTYYCRDYFIEYRISSTQRYTLLIQFQRPHNFGSVVFADVFKSLHAVRPKNPQAN